MLIRPKLSLRPELLLRIGLGLLFLTNAVTAWFNPDEFREILSTSFLGMLFGPTDWLIPVIGINDTVLGLLIMSGWWRTITAIWASLWVLGVIAVTGIVTPEFALHLGVLALIAAYAAPIQTTEE